VAGPAALAGVLLGLAVPPWGFWPLGFLGMAGLFLVIEPLDARGRALAGFVTGASFYAMTLWWMTEFTVAAVAVFLVEAAFLALAAVLVPAAAGPRWRWVAWPAAVLFAEALRGKFVVGGLPLGGLDLGLVSSPLAPAARIGGRLLLATLAAVAGVAIVAAVRRRPAVAAGALAVLVAAPLAGALLPHGHGTTAVRTSLVQGGGRRGYRAIHSDASLVFNAQVLGTDGVRGPLDLLFWPEDVVDVDLPVASTPEGEVISRLAQRFHTTLIAGVVEPAGPGHFHNLVVAWDANGNIVGRVEKAHRVPFGEYIPLRGVIEKVYDLSVVPRDAVKGHGPGLLRTPAGPFGVMISYEVFFPHRGRAGVRAGGEVLLVPTNAASFRTSQVPTQELAAARIRALESGRWLVQAGPTGYGAFIDPNGRLVSRTRLGDRAVLSHRVTRRTGLTVLSRFGPTPWVLVALGLLVAAHRRAYLTDRSTSSEP
jgi:apolipoprotein N-acyltransferase